MERAGRISGAMMNTADIEKYSRNQTVTNHPHGIRMRLYTPLAGLEAGYRAATYD